MKRLHTLSLIILMLIGCMSNKQSDQEKKHSTADTLLIAKNSDMNNQEPKASRPRKSYPKADTLISDTILIDSFRIIIQPIEKEDYADIYESSGIKEYPSSSTSKIVENFNEKAQRLNDSVILIKLQSGITDTVADYYSKGGLGFATYKYIDYLDEIYSHLIAGKYYEADSYVLVSDSTGEMDKRLLSSNVSIDSTRQRLITYAWDGFAFHFGGFTIFDISKGKMDRLFTYYQKNPEQDGFFWSLSNVIFLSTNELIYIHQIYVRKNHRILKSYAKMTIEKTTSN